MTSENIVTSLSLTAVTSEVFVVAEVSSVVMETVTPCDVIELVSGSVKGNVVESVGTFVVSEELLSSISEGVELSNVMASLLCAFVEV